MRPVIDPDMSRVQIRTPLRVTEDIRRRSLLDSRGRNRNWKILPPFISLSFVRTVGPIPTELYNEPFSFLDTEERPEIITTRPAFLFKIEEDRRVMIRVGTRSRRVGISGSRHIKLPQKATSNVSVLNVYDTYGLDISWLYIQHLYYHKYDAVNGRWLEFYLLASLTHIQPEAMKEFDRPEINVLYVCSCIMIELTHLESKKVKMLGDLVPSKILPHELVSRIVGSQRISKNIREHVRAIKCRDAPSYDQLLVANDLSGLNATSLTESVYITSNWMLFREDDLYILEANTNELECNGEIVQFSLHDYSRAFSMRDCDGSQSTMDMLRSLQLTYETIADEEIGDVCAWIVQLSNDVGGEVGCFDLPGLRDELQRLLALSLEKDW